ncbi:Nucleoside-diphosphate-sugar pyrophosphorylase family protein [Burkholderiales bacterium JOSHI_001]|nr:Nucleoside-diphosphate-sugar pyrophosphorylase family protein [Burkholderiales bacterium JOSHI_001]
MSNLKALILAAGRGERMRPLTDATPKPLLLVRGKPLIEWHLEALANAGVTEVVINTAWLEDQFPAALGDGSRFGLRLHYSFEGRDHGGALETAGGIAKALPRLASGPREAFWVVSGDVFLPGFPFDAATAQRFGAGPLNAHLWLTHNAPHHPQGDFGIDAQGLAVAQAPQRHTWASVGLFRAGMFADVAVGTRLALRPLLEAQIAQQGISAELWPGAWTDVGTIQRLQALNAPPA